MRVSSLLIGAATSLSLFFASAVFPARAFAQNASVSDADRKAARDLFFQGVDLQNAGKFADALDKFQRAQAVVNAPTNLLHIAECQAAMNKLVEAAETYRAVGRYPLPANPPQPFVAAQSQAAGELAQLEPKIPEVTVEVTPANIPTLQVTIDDQPIPNALVGVGRPINPGPHKIVAQAPGYSREEKTVEVKERSKQRVPLELKATGAVTYGAAGTGGAAGGTAVAQNGGGAGTGTTPASGAATGTTPVAGEKPPPYQEQKAPEYRSRTSILLGLRLGAAIPAGNVPLSSGALESAGKYSGPGAGIGLEGMFRFVRVMYVGALLQGESYGNGSSSLFQSKRSSSGGVAMLTLGWISNPDGFGVILNGGIGVRWYSLDNPTVQAGTSDPQIVTESASGAAGQLGVGFHIRTGKIFRLTPKLEVNFGSLEASNAPPGATAAKGGGSTIWLGLGGDFDINLDKGPK